MKRILTVLALAVVMIALPMSTVFADKCNVISVYGETSMTFDMGNYEFQKVGANEGVFLEHQIEIWMDSEYAGPDDVAIFGESYQEYVSLWVAHNMAVCPEECVDCFGACMEDGGEYLDCMGQCCGDCMYPIDEDGLCMGPETWLTINQVFTLNVEKIGETKYNPERDTLTIMLNSQGDWGLWEIIRGTGRLKNLRGGGKFSTSMDITEPGVYEGQIYFVPD